MDPNRTVNVAVEVIPIVRDPYRVVDRAIQVIQDSGVAHEVGPMETTMEGPLDRLLEVAKAAHLACFAAGAAEVVTIIKIGDRIDGATMEEKVGRYRRGGDAE